MKVRNGTASCFTLTKNGQQFLVTAAHVVEGYPDKEEIEVDIFHDKQWKKLGGLLHCHTNRSIDVAVIKLPFTIAPHFNICFDANILYGQDLFFLGFPYGRYSENDLNRSYPFAFVKKGVFSSVKDDSLTGTIFFLDGHNNKGFSGGPVGFYEVKTKKTFIVAVLSGYLPDKGRITSPVGTLRYDENSGIVQAYDIKHAHEIMDAMF